MNKWLLGLLAPFFWGTTFTVMNLSLQDASPLWVSVWRALPAGLILLLLYPRRFPLPAAKMLLLAFLNISCFFALLFFSAYRLPGSVAGTLQATFPILLMFTAWLAYGERPSRMGVMFSLMGLGGVALLLNPGGNTDVLGVLSGLLAVWLVARCALWVQRWQIDSLLAMTAWQLFLGGLFLLPLAYWLEGPMPPINLPMLAGLVWIVLLCTALAYWAFFVSTKRLTTEELGLMTLLNPLVAVISGVWLVNENLTPWQWCGVVLIIVAIAAIIEQNRIRRLLSQLNLRWPAS